tara:strand:+ start:265 stop:816 length:552 start_codon:yes stop_codon:yes gene_type:complete
MIYLDMDGVVADFFGGFAKRNGVRHWKDIQDYDAALDDLKGTDFFYTLKKFSPLADRIWLLVQEQAREHGLEWGYCTSPLRGDEHNSAYWKRRWLEGELMMPPKVKNLIITANKHKYAETLADGGPSILIDDKPANIHRWRQAGGIGIRFQANEDDFQYLRSQLSWALAERETRLKGNTFEDI